jgi:hypothetical protein
MFAISVTFTLRQATRIAIAEEGYEQPEAKELRRVMRLFAFSARRGRQGKVDIQYVLKYERGYLAKPCLAKFVLDRLELKLLPENQCHVKEQ